MDMSREACLHKKYIFAALFICPCFYTPTRDIPETHILIRQKRSTNCQLQSNKNNRTK